MNPARHGSAAPMNLKRMMRRVKINNQALNSPVPSSSSPAKFDSPASDNPGPLSFSHATTSASSRVLTACAHRREPRLHPGIILFCPLHAFSSILSRARIRHHHSVRLTRKLTHPPPHHFHQLA